MFGGYGIFHEGLMFALVADDKVDVKWPHGKYGEDEMEEYKEKILKFLR